MNGTVWLSNMNCVGSESTVRECLLSGMGDTISEACKTHEYDMAVKCYANGRLTSIVVYPVITKNLLKNGIRPSEKNVCPVGVLA